MHSALKLSAKVISSLMAGFIVYMFAGGLIYAMQHPGSMHIRPLTTAAGRHDALMLGMMALVVAAMLLVWWKEKAGAWLSVISVTAIILCVRYLNGIPFTRLAGFFVAIVPALVLLITPATRRGLREAAVE